MPLKIPIHRPAWVRPPGPLYERMPSRREDKAFYSGGKWRKLRAAFLGRHPLCAECQAAGRPVPAVDVHHRLERKDRPDLAYEWSNLQALCKPCHNGQR